MARKTTTTRRKKKAGPKASAGVFRRILRAAAWFMAGIVGLVLLLRFVPPPTSAFMLARHVEGLLDGASPVVMYSWTPMERIPQHMALAVVAAEDQNFPRHVGFDVGAIARAVEQNQKGGALRGASTITQQTAKNLFLWSGRSYVRKALEAGLTVLIELLWTKERILEVYLNIAEFGDGTYGVAAAARRFFGTSPAGLDRHQAALLAAVLPNPRRLLAHRPSPYVLDRARWIRTQMRQLGDKHVDFR